jgi:hypothetical protein
MTEYPTSLDRRDALRIARLLLPSDESLTVELRAFGVSGGRSIRRGFYDDAEKLAHDAIELSKCGASGVYVTPNDVSMAARRLKVRMNRHGRVTGGGSCAGNDDVPDRRWLLLDFDPIRPSGTSATEDELSQAILRARAVAESLSADGWSEPVRAVSGNGAHLMYRVDLPADDCGLIKGVTHALSEQWSDDEVTLDPAVHNAARIWKLYGTMARKGEDSEERPHRAARLVEVSEPVEVVPAALLIAVLKRRAGADESERTSGAVDVRSGEEAWSEGDVREMLRCVRVDRPPYDEWVRLIAATCDALGGDEGAAARALMGRWPEEKEGEYAAKLRSRLGEVSRGTLLRAARAGGFRFAREREAARERIKPLVPPPPGRVSSARIRPEVGRIVADVQRERIRWLWPGRLAVGKLTLLDGDPGLGKSVLYCDLAARMTSGRPWPGEEEHPASSDESGRGVVIVTCEDGLADTIRPRLEEAGADLSRVIVVQTVPVWIEARDGEPGRWGERVPTLPDDLPLIEEAAARVDAGLLVIDPLFGHLSPRLNSHKDQDVRQALGPLAAVAERLGLAVLIVRHLNKQSGGKAMYRGGGSIGISGAARVGLLVGRSPQDESEVILAQTKNNVAREQASLAFAVVPSSKDAEVPVVDWRGESELSAQDLVCPPPGEGAAAPAREQAEELLREVLASGTAAATDVYDEAERRGIRKATLRRAREALGVVCERVGGISSAGRWYWSLPGPAAVSGDGQAGQPATVSG